MGRERRNKGYKKGEEQEMADMKHEKGRRRERAHAFNSRSSTVYVTECVWKDERSHAGG